MNLGGSVKINKCGMLIVTLLLFVVLYYFSFQKRYPSSAYDSSKNLKEINLRKLLIGSIQAAQKGGDVVLAVSKTMNLNTESKGKTKEGVNDPITDADRRSHCIMQQGLQRIFPKLKIISEEDDVVCPDVHPFDLDPTVLPKDDMPEEIVPIEDVTVWIDPLDATKEFTEKLFQYVTTMVCVAVKGRPVIGVVHNPFTKKTTWAWQGRALSDDLEKVSRKEAIPKNPIIIVSRSHSGDVVQQTKQIFGEHSSIIPAGGAGMSSLQYITGVKLYNIQRYLQATKFWKLCSTMHPRTCIPPISRSGTYAPAMPS